VCFEVLAKDGHLKLVLKKGCLLKIQTILWINEKLFGQNTTDPKAASKIWTLYKTLRD